MKFRNIGIKYGRMNQANGGDQGGGAGGGQGQQMNNQQQQQTGEQNNHNQNHNQNPEPTYEDLWQTNNNSNQNMQHQQQQFQQQQQQQTDPIEALNAHIQSLNLTNGIDPSKIMQDMANSDPASFQEALNTISQNVYKAVLGDSQKLIESQKDKIIEEAVKTSNTNVQSDTLVRDMKSKLEFTNDPAFEPIAKGVLAQFIKKGQSPNEAIENVGKYFTQLGNKINSQQNSQEPGSGNWNNNSNASEVNWDDIWQGLS